MDYDIRAVLLSVIEELQPRSPGDANLQTTSVLEKAATKLKARGNPELEQAILTQWHELFRTGYLAWGYNMPNPSPPFFHVTKQGRRALAQLSRDPGNPDGYLAHVRSVSELGEIAQSYLEEGLSCFVGGLFKASAVMVGAATESIVLHLRDSVVEFLKLTGEDVPKGLNDWKLKQVLSALENFFDDNKKKFNARLRENYEAYWTAFTRQIRSVRNDAGHPTSINPITSDAVHGTLLIFPEVAKLGTALEGWLNNEKPK